LTPLLKQALKAKMACAGILVIGFPASISNALEFERVVNCLLTKIAEPRAVLVDESVDQEDPICSMYSTQKKLFKASSF
jgi:hypothetical protein